jgi:hypothetical protein
LSAQQLPFIGTETYQAASPDFNNPFYDLEDSSPDRPDRTFLKVVLGNDDFFKSDDFMESSVRSVSHRAIYSHEAASKAGLSGPDRTFGFCQEEKSSVRNGNLTSQSGEGEQEVNNADLLSAYQSLYQQIGKTREKLAPLGSILWHVPNSGFEEVEQVNLAEYQHRLKEIYTSGDSRRLAAGRDEMLRKLGVKNNDQ